MKTIVHPKKRGEWVELQFMARAAHHGLTVSKPWGDTARYDFIVEHGGRFQRVQVKSTTMFATVRPGRTRSAYLCNTVSRGPTVKTPGRSYLATEIDFFAFYIIPEDVWYIVPIADVRRARFAVYLNPYQRHNKYFRFMEAWHLFTMCGAARQNPARYVSGG
ncbi:MAG: group I intron-associated PD-(D/E)XK endonuclease [Terriglobales bacterium]|jgi:hypothetical protein